jgi:hypothetical protein
LFEGIGRLRIGVKLFWGGVPFLLLLGFSLFSFGSKGDPDASASTNYKDCLLCHRGIEQISQEHGFDCRACHLNPVERAKAFLRDHREIVRNPSSPSHVRTFCLPCHDREIRESENSIHATMAGIINQTRYLWGAQKTSAPATYGLSGPFAPLPEPDALEYPDEPRKLVDDFLRRKCLRCHLNRAGMEGNGLFRASGCAACHVLYENDGRYTGRDQAIAPSVKGYPATHRFTKRIPDEQCLHCHNGNHVGGDYVGLFEHDYHSAYRSPLVGGKPLPRVYGMDQHHLAKDIHAEKGLLCIDCHTRGAVMGDGKIYSYEMEVPKRSCSDCHGGFDSPMPDPSIKEILKSHKGFLFFSKGREREHPLPLFSTGVLDHRIPAHKRVRCSACHAQWSYQDYGLSVIREDVLEGNQWHYLTSQGDPSVEKTLEMHLKAVETRLTEASKGPPRSYPTSEDWLRGEDKAGIWLSGWRFRRWEPMPLGIDDRGKYAILRPLYQFLVSYVDRAGNVVLDSATPSRGDGSGKGWAYMPYVPHTTSPFGRQCDRCHFSRIAAGLGIQEEATSDTELAVPSPPAVQTMRLMNPREREGLLNPSHEVRRGRLRSLNKGPSGPRKPP